MKKIKLNTVINIFSFILIIIGFYFLFRNGDWNKIVSIKDKINYWGLAGVAILVTFCQFLVIFRWYLLLIPIKNGITLRSIFRIAINAIVLNHTAPGKVGYPTKAYFLKKMENIPISSSIPSLFGELFLDYSMTGALFLTAALIGGYLETIFKLLSNYIEIRNIWIIALAVILSAVLSILLKQRLQSSKIFKNVIAAIQLTRRRSDIIFWSITITVIYLFVWFVSDYLLLISLGYRLPLNFLIFVGAFTNIVVLLAPLPGGLGVREITGAYLFKVFYNLGEVAVVLILLSRLFSLLALVILYFGERIVELINYNKKLVNEVTDPEISSNIS